MFAPKPFDVAKEMVRVTQPGGRIVMGNWIPGDPTLVAQILKISAAYSPPPPGGLRQPDDLGRRGRGARALRRRRHRAGADRLRAGTPGPSTTRGRRRSSSALFRDYYGPTMNAFAAAEANGRARTSRPSSKTSSRTRTATDSSTSIPATYLRVVVNT